MGLTPNRGSLSNASLPCVLPSNLLDSIKTEIQKVGFVAQKKTGMTDQELTLQAVGKAQRIIEEYLQPIPHDVAIVVSVVCALTLLATAGEQILTPVWRALKRGAR